MDFTVDFKFVMKLLTKREKCPVSCTVIELNYQLQLVCNAIDSEKAKPSRMQQVTVRFSAHICSVFNFHHFASVHCHLRITLSIPKNRDR